MLLLGACTQAPPPAPGVAAIAPDPNDACARQQQNFANARNLFAASVITGAAVGAVAGSAVRIRIGGFGVAPGAVGALGGLAAGALAGAAVGSYLDQRRREAGDDAALAAAVAGDVAKENENLDLARNAAEFLLDCRLRRAQDIREAARARHAAAGAGRGAARHAARPGRA